MTEARRPDETVESVETTTTEREVGQSPDNSTERTTEERESSQSFGTEKE